MSDAKREIDLLRHQMASADEQILAALEQRARAAKRIGALRAAAGGTLSLHDAPLPDALVAGAGREMPKDALRDIFRVIHASTVGLELPARIAFAGPEGGGAHAAARGRFGAAAAFVASESTASCLDEVARQRVDFAVVPFETSIDGPVQSSITALTASDLRIAEVVEQKTELHLMNRTGNAADIEKVYAHAGDRALAARALLSIAPKVAVLDVRSPLLACQIAAEDHGAAALVTETFGAELGLKVARRNILDQSNERVRYAVVGTRPSSRTGADRTAVVFSVHDEPGALLFVLKQFADRGINLTKIQSRPVQGGAPGEAPGDAWAYLFFAEVLGHATDRVVVTAFEDVKRSTKFFKVLGSYPAG
jgi:chorismate mutase/prephenate dehydratase